MHETDPGWFDVPAGVRQIIEGVLGGKVSRISRRATGFDETRAFVVGNGDIDVFVKAAPIAAAEENYYAREQMVNKLCLRDHPFPAPTMQMSTEVDGWQLLVFDYVNGRQLDLLSKSDIGALLRSCERIASVKLSTKQELVLLPRVPLDDAHQFTDFSLAAQLLSDRHGLRPDRSPAFQRVLATMLAIACRDTHLHRELVPFSVRKSIDERLTNTPERREPFSFGNFDLKPSNVLIDSNNDAVIVDWSMAGFGPPWRDLAMFLLTQRVRTDREVIFSSTDLGRSAVEINVDVFIAQCALSWIERTMADSGVPESLKRHARNNAANALSWFGERYPGLGLNRQSSVRTGNDLLAM